MLEALPGFQFPGLLNPEQQHACGGRRNNRSRRERTYGGQGDRTRWFVVMVIRAAWMLGIKIHLTAFLALTSALFTCSSSTSWALRPCQVEIDLSLFDRLALPCRLGQMRISILRPHLLAIRIFFFFEIQYDAHKHALTLASVKIRVQLYLCEHLLWHNAYTATLEICNCTAIDSWRTWTCIHHLPNYVNFLSKQMQNWTTESGSFSVRANVACHCKHESWRRNIVHQCFNRRSRGDNALLQFPSWSNLGYQ